MRSIYFECSKKESQLAIGVTTGNSLTAATAVEGALAAATRMDIDPARARVAVLGATGSIGAVCCRLLAPQVAGLVPGFYTHLTLPTISSV